jgi:hypothetical protein
MASSRRRLPMRNRHAIYLRYLTSLIIQACIIGLYVHHCCPRAVPRNWTTFWMALGFCLVSDITRTGMASVNEWIDDLKARRRSRYWRSHKFTWAPPCGDCAFCKSGGQCPYTLVRTDPEPRSRSRAFLSL